MDSHFQNGNQDVSEGVWGHYLRSSGGAQIFGVFEDLWDIFLESMVKMGNPAIYVEGTTMYYFA